MAADGWIVDKSALVRLGTSNRAEEWAQRIERGLVCITTVTRLEVGFSARSGHDLRAELSRPPLSAMPVEYQTPGSEDRAVAVQALLADHGHHRSVSVPDLIVAATAASGLDGPAPRQGLRPHRRRHRPTHRTS